MGGLRCLRNPTNLSGREGVEREGGLGRPTDWGGLGCLTFPRDGGGAQVWNVYSRAENTLDKETGLILSGTSTR